MHIIGFLFVGFVLLLKLVLVVVAGCFAFFAVKDLVTEKTGKKREPKSIKVVRLPGEPMLRFTCRSCHFHSSMTVDDRNRRDGTIYACPKCGAERRFKTREGA